MFILHQTRRFIRWFRLYRLRRAGVWVVADNTANAHAMLREAIRQAREDQNHP